MNKLMGVVAAIALLAGGFYLGQARQPAPTVIKVPSEPKAAFTSSGAEEVAAAAVGPANVRSLHTPTSGES